MRTDALLLDTHIWIWLLFDELERAPAALWKTVGNAAMQQAVAISEISLWEVAVKSGKRKLDIGDPRAWLRHAQKMPGLAIVQADRDILIDSALLELPHRDPADRILIATALRYGLRLVTADAALIASARAVKGLQLLDAR